MKKTLVTLAIVAFTAVSYTCSAQTVKARATVQPLQVCEAAAAEECQPGGPCMFFEGITLTPDQQTRLKAVKKPAHKAHGKKAECTVADCKKDDCKVPECKKNDCRDCRDCTKADCKEAAKACKKTDCRAEYIAQVKEILTPDQYVIFLENVAKAPAAKGHKAKGLKARDGKRPAKAHKACDRAAKSCDKAAKTCDNAAKTCTKPAPATAK